MTLPRTPRLSRRATVAAVAVAVAGVVLTAVSASALTASPGPVPGAAAPQTVATRAQPFLGGATSDRDWYNDAVGLPQIVRSYDGGFHYATWQDTAAYAEHGNQREDYSFKIPPAQLAAGAYDARLRQFLATTPRNFIFTNYHEPEQEVAAGDFTAAQFRAAIVRLAALVHAQNAVDQGTRMVSVILMGVTFSGFKGRDPMAFWPGRDSATGRSYADILSVDTYSVPHGTGLPQGYTDGTGWRSSSYLLDPAIAFASAQRVPWMVSEFGFPEDMTDPTHKARAINDFVTYALARGAIALEYFDEVGNLGDWRLRHSTAAAAAWRAAVAAR